MSELRQLIEKTCLSWQLQCTWCDGEYDPCTIEAISDLVLKVEEFYNNKNNSTTTNTIDVIYYYSLGDSISF